ncbi:hypothetical protein MWX50_003539 [Morganella morganii]|nr:hypothetical protein [Morganella morganii]
MNIGELLEIDKPSDLEIKKLKNIAIYSSDAAVNLIEGIGAVGTLMFQNSCSDNDNLNKDIIGKLGLLIQESIIIANALTGNAGLAEDEIKSRSAPPLRNQKPDEQRNEIIGVIGDINNAELSIQQLKSDLYENEPEKEIIFAQLDLVASKLSGSLDQLEKMTGNNHD